MCAAATCTARIGWSRSGGAMTTRCSCSSGTTTVAPLTSTTCCSVPSAWSYRRSSGRSRCCEPDDSPPVDQQLVASITAAVESLARRRPLRRGSSPSDDRQRGSALCPSQLGLDVPPCHCSCQLARRAPNISWFTRVGSLHWLFDCLFDRQQTESCVAGRQNEDRASGQLLLRIGQAGQQDADLRFRSAWGAPKDHHARARMPPERQELPEVRVGRQHDSTLLCGGGHHSVVSGSEEVAVTDMDGVVAGSAEQARNPGGQGLVD